MKSKTFLGRFESLAEIGDFIRQAAQEAGLDCFASYAVETAVDEACSNIIEHAYPCQNDGTIECSYEISDTQLTITLKDYGRPFNPAEIPEPDLDAPLEERLEHGLGLFFMRKLMDEIHFEFDDLNGNRLIMVKRKESETK